MWNTFDTTAALAQARSSNTPLSEIKKGSRHGQGALAKGESVAGVLETLSALIPTGVAALYTLLALAEQVPAVSDQKMIAAKHAAKLSKMGESKAAIASALSTLPLESKHFLYLRYATVLIFAAAVFLLSFTASGTGTAKAKKAHNDATAKDPKGAPTKTPSAKRQGAPAITAVVAFLAWALASPGTPLGAKFTTPDLAVITTVIAGMGALFVLILGTAITNRSIRDD